jgi:hypothetical protein
MVPLVPADHNITDPQQRLQVKTDRPSTMRTSSSVPNGNSSRLLLASLSATLLNHYISNAFAPSSLAQHRLTSYSSPLISPSRLHSTNQSPDAPQTPEEDAALQWDLFTRYHAVDGEWWGTWTSYDYMGDVIDTTVAGSVCV